MSRSAALARLATIVVATATGTQVAHADQTHVGAFFGPRVFSDDSLLGYIQDAPAHPTLENGIQFGARIARPFFPWLIPELELGMSSTQSTRELGAPAADVFWLDPRLHLRFEFTPGQRFIPFVVVGGGSPIALSSARKTFDTGIVGAGYLGGGMRYDTFKGFAFRVDARVALLPGIDRPITAEIDVGVGIELQLGKLSNRQAGKKTVIVAEPDRDLDGIIDKKDACPDRPEDADGVDDLDGCPDIDNDKDGVLDIADKCGTVPEQYNGFADDDGCPDTVPPEVDALRGTVEGLLYAEGETVVRESAKPSLKKIADLMRAHPSIRVVLIGHTDDREAKKFATPGQPASAEELTTLAADLSRARAEAVKQALAELDVPAGRVEVEGHGGDEPVSDNDKPKGRLANRRVEIKLYVPPR